MTFLASKLMISSLTPREPRNRFIAVQLVSVLPIKVRTAKRTSLTLSGGCLIDLTSLMFSDLIEPTAARAESIIGWISASCFSMGPRLALRSASSLPSFTCSSSTSFLRSLAADIATVMRCSASSASICFSARSLCCSLACVDNSET